MFSTFTIYTIIVLFVIFLAYAFATNDKLVSAVMAICGTVVTVSFVYVGISFLVILTVVLVGVLLPVFVTIKS